jgi:hypothetical protein
MNFQDKNNREYKWYIEPLNSQTNSSVSTQLPAENFCQPACKDGQSHNLWQCSFQLARSFWESRENSGLHLKIYIQEKNGKIRSADFLFRRKKKRQSKTAL